MLITEAKLQLNILVGAIIHFDEAEILEWARAAFIYENENLGPADRLRIKKAEYMLPFMCLRDTDRRCSVSSTKV